jgi:hypothetical protein
MSLLFKGVSRLSELEIDIDKDMGGFGLTNLKEVVAGMGVGDTIFHDGTGIQKLAPGMSSSVLATRGPGHDPYYGWVA